MSNHPNNRHWHNGRSHALGHRQHAPYNQPSTATPYVQPQTIYPARPAYVSNPRFTPAPVAPQPAYQYAYQAPTALQQLQPHPHYGQSFAQPVPPTPAGAFTQATPTWPQSIHYNTGAESAPQTFSSQQPYQSAYAQSPGWIQQHYQHQHSDYPNFVPTETMRHSHAQSQSQSSLYTPVSLNASTNSSHSQLPQHNHSMPAPGRAHQTPRQWSAHAQGDQVTYEPTESRDSRQVEGAEASAAAEVTLPWKVPNSDSEAPLFAKPEHLRRYSTLEHLTSNLEILLTYFPREINGLNLAEVAENHSDALITKAMNAAREPGDYFTEEQVRKEIAAAFVLYSPKVLSGSDPVLEVQVWGQKRRDKARKGQLRDVLALPKQNKEYYAKAVFNQCMLAVHKWIAENDCPTWVTDRLNGFWHRAAAGMDDWWQECIQGAKSLKDTLSILCKWVNAGQGDAGGLVAELWDDVMGTFASEWRRGEIERYAYLADSVKDFKEWSS